MGETKKLEKFLNNTFHEFLEKSKGELVENPMFKKGETVYRVGGGFTDFKWTGGKVTFGKGESLYDTRSNTGWVSNDDLVFFFHTKEEAKAYALLTLSQMLS